MTGLRYFEDLQVGQRFDSEPLKVELDAIREFAGTFDPQPFHLDEAAARSSLFGELVASGWHTAALTMRLLVASNLNLAGGVIGAGVEMSWPKPLRPGETIQLAIEVLELRVSKSKPMLGIAKLRIVTKDSSGDPVQIMNANILAPRRAAP